MNRNEKNLLLHDNARPHVADLTKQKMGTLGMTDLLHPAYSPDLAPSDYHLFRSLEHYLREKKFKSKEEIKCVLLIFFYSKPAEFYKKGIFDLPNRWQKVIENNGNYFV